MTSAVSIYKEREVNLPYYQAAEDEYWDNYHTLFLEDGIEEETIALLLDLNPRLDILNRPTDFLPKSIFNSDPHVLITDDSEKQFREFYIEDYLEAHLGWKDKKSPQLYSQSGFDVFLICKGQSNDPWREKPSVLGLEFLTLHDYQVWLEKFPGNG